MVAIKEGGRGCCRLVGDTVGMMVVTWWELMLGDHPTQLDASELSIPDNSGDVVGAAVG